MLMYIILFSNFSIFIVIVLIQNILPDLIISNNSVILINFVNTSEKNKDVLSSHFFLSLKNNLC